MSNFLAVAAITELLRRTLQSAIDFAANENGGVSAKVDTSRPGSTVIGTGPAVSIFLARVTPNGALDNTDLPFRRSGGDVMQQPTTALNLHYLISFYGEEEHLEPQRLMGVVVRELHSESILTHDSIRQAVQKAKNDLHDSNGQLFLQFADLADQVELVKFTHVSLSAEELSKTWSVFPDIAYSLTLAYDASVVLIDGELTPKTPLPVTNRGVYVMPFREPRIDQAISEGNNLIIVGQQLFGDITRVRVFGVDVVVGRDGSSDARIVLALTEPPLPANVIRAGVQTVQVIQSTLMGVPSTPHAGFESNVATFLLHPTVQSFQASNVGGGADSRSGTITASTVTPKLRKGQRVTLLLNEWGSAGTPASYTFPRNPLESDMDSVSIDFAEVKQAQYLVRIRVDGADSALVQDSDPNSSTFNQFVQPRVSL